MIMGLRGVAACNDELECCSLLVTTLRNVFRVQDAFSTMVMCVLPQMKNSRKVRGK